MALNGLICADVPLSNYSLTYYHLLVTEFPHSTCIGYHILLVIYFHIFTPAFYTYSVSYSRIPALPHFINTLTKLGL